MSASRIVEKLTDNKFLNIKQVKDPEMGVGGYQFAERKGKNSVAFICYDKDTELFLLNNEYKPPTNEFILGAFGGSIDKDMDYNYIVKAEVKEEAGFDVDIEDILCVGTSFVSTQMNQYCYLYLVYVDGKNQGEREPENAIEELAKTRWVVRVGIDGLDDWKAITIVAKASNIGVI